MDKHTEDVHEQLSELSDSAENIYVLTKEIAGVAKRIKFDAREEIEQPIPVLESVSRIYAADQ